MTDDFGRTTMIMRFFCHNCGAELSMTYDDPKARIDKHRAGDPPGAYVRYLNHTVKPCQSCIDKELSPARAIAKAVAAITEANNE